MIEIKKVTEPAQLAERNVREDEHLFAAFEDGEITGFCKYKLDGQTVVLLELNERSGDLLLADGVARTAIASCRGKADRVKCRKAGMLPAFMALTNRYDENGEAALERVLRGSCDIKDPAEENAKKSGG